MYRTRIIGCKVVARCRSGCNLTTATTRYSDLCEQVGTAMQRRRSYSAPRPPAAAPSEALHLYNSLSKKIEPISYSASDNGNKGIAFYTCGPTVYAPAHLGHARTYVCLDIVRRVLEHQYAQHRGGSSNSTMPSSPVPPPPLFVMNVTDVDDKILATAAARDETDSLSSPLALARHYEAAFWSDLDRLNVLRPHVVTRVTEHVETAILPYIQRLVDNGTAYCATSGDVYFDVRAFEDRTNARTRYGKLAPPVSATDFYSRLDQTAETVKRDPRDFVLWKRRKEGEALFWTAPVWGEGRPGWHIECSAMIQAVQEQFQQTHRFVVHAGGVDLQFPHHTNEIAQAEAHVLPDMDNVTDTTLPVQEWIPHWIHTGHVHIDGLKMSKSLKNFVSIEELLQDDNPSSLSSPADDFRLWCLGMSGSYRGPATYSRDAVSQSSHVREKLVRFLLDGERWLSQAGDGGTKRWSERDVNFMQLANDVVARSNSALSSDLNGSLFVKQMTRLAEAGGAYLQTTSPSDGPVEVVRSAIRILREQLGLVGFSDATTRAGMASIAKDTMEAPSNVVGGEQALLEALVSFRTSIRRSALTHVSLDDAPKALLDILDICDQARNVTFPQLGVELLDGKEDAQKEASSWKYCIPRVSVKEAEGSESVAANATLPNVRLKDLTNIPLETLFRDGPSYRGQFSAYDELGVPTHYVDGTEVSKRQRQKLQKKRNIHAKRLQAAAPGQT
jgi:cysteinyl-tRNA synthetase